MGDEIQFDALLCHLFALDNQKPLHGVVVLESGCTSSAFSRFVFQLDMHEIKWKFHSRFIIAQPPPSTRCNDEVLPWLLAGAINI